MTSNNTKAGRERGGAGLVRARRRKTKPVRDSEKNYVTLDEN